MAKISAEEAKARLKKSAEKPLEEKKMSKRVAPLMGEPMVSGDEIELVDVVNDNLFIFKNEGKYVLSPADDTLEPVIGEFDEVSSENEIPPSMKEWLDTYSKEINYFQQNEEEIMQEQSDEVSVDNAITMVDLGLSVNWGNMNIGATKPEEFGGYYAWGEIETKAKYTIATYKYYNTNTSTYTEIGDDISKNETYDVAYKTNNSMCMPTEKQFKELIDKCTWTKKTVNNVSGWEVKGPNGNTIFLPINGCYTESDKVSYTTYGYYWSSTDYASNNHQARTLRVTTKPEFYTMYKRTGAAIRPVSVKANAKNELVDLGLSVNWANMNIGATKPEECGGYYAWAEKEEKDSYTWDNYKYYNKIPESYKNLGSNIAKTSYDQAYAKSKSMCLPTEEQWKELQSKCTFTEKTVDGVVGFEVKGTNGNTIFLPFCGCTYDGKSAEPNTYAYFATSNPSKTDYQTRCAKFGTKSYKAIVDIRRRTGVTIRPIATGETDANQTTIKFVDLGLSVKWGDMNLGATKACERGDWYAWGDLEANKKNFNYTSYKYYTAGRDESLDLGYTITQNPDYDVAYSMDKEMCIPKASHWEELVKNCTWTEKTQNGVKGFEVKGPNGNTIFLPHAGYKLDKKLYYAGEQGIYTSACYYSTNVNQYRRTCDWKTGGKPSVTYTRKRAGCVVRPISVKVNDLKKTIDPIIPFMWSQGAPYSNLLPNDPSTNKKVVTGCTNTAMAMIIAYYGCIGINGTKYRRGCTKVTSYVSNKGKASELTLSALPSLEMFDYDNLNFKKAADFKTAESKKAVAQLMQYLGYANRSSYSSSGTGASVTNAMTTARDKMHLGNSPKIIYASSGVDNFKEQIYNELKQGFPVFFAGWNSSGSSGHAFICDGYNASTGKYHFNWGWGGSYNGWFDVSILKPSSSYDFSYSKRCIIGLHPDYIFGDVNKDGTVSVTDVMTLVQAILDNKTDFKYDINSDGSVNITDVMTLVDYILGK